MKKDVLFLVFDERNWEENYVRAKTILGDVALVHGSRDIESTFKMCADLAKTEMFVLIDGDNHVHSNASMELENAVEPTVFFSTNRYGVKYGHGGIKVISKKSIFSGLAVDVTERLSLPATTTVISTHSFDHSSFSHWKSIFKELIKLKLWGNTALLDAWLSSPIPKDVYHLDVIPFLKRASMDEVANLLLRNTNLDLEYAMASNRNTQHMFLIQAEHDTPGDIIGF